MLCSISAGKSASNWLDRLRSSKGFPPGDDIDLEQFLSLQTSNVPNSPDGKSIDPNANSIAHSSNFNRSKDEIRTVLVSNDDVESSSQNGERELFSRVGNVLAELFNMGDSNDFPRIQSKKSSRKQSNPRICVVSASVGVCDIGPAEGCSPMLPSSGDSSRVDLKEAGDHLKESGNVGEEDDKAPHLDLSVFSRTEVTVIDTSCPIWKFDKLLFRRKNVWKVRDKKTKAMNAEKKKRKASLLDHHTAGSDKKAKVSALQCSSSEERNGKIGAIPSNDVLHHHSDENKEVFKVTKDTFSQIHKMSSPKKIKKSGSSVILIKSIPASKKTGATIQRNSQKSSQRQQKS